LTHTLAQAVGAWIDRAIAVAPAGHVPLLMLSGPQGAGKSTALAEALAALDRPVAGLSLDDVYLTRAERTALAARVSPLLQTRGPPGTHDLDLLAETIAALRGAGEDTQTPLPVFDKLADDRAPREDWRRFTGRAAAIVIEGWMMGALPDEAAPDAPPLNAVEASDTDRAWRRYQEAALAGAYADLWDRADGFCHLAAPDFACVAGWRLQQEAGLWAARGEATPAARRDWVLHFIQHYERVTRRMIAGGRRPGTVIEIDTARNVIAVSGAG
jgi:D-glycerate 3-kinase